MTQFQTVQPPPLGADLQLPQRPSPSPLTKIGLHLGSQITLELIPDGGSSARDFTVFSDKPEVQVLNSNVTGNKVTFELKARGAGTAQIGWRESATGSMRFATPLTVVAGEFRKHIANGLPLEVDLLADLARGSDGYLINEVRKLLHNDANNLFDQMGRHNHHRTAGNMTCGMVCKERSAQLFGKINKLNYEQPYHEPLRKVTKRSDVKYKPETMLGLRTQIIALLKTGSPVRVGVLDYPIGMFVSPGGKLIAWYKGGHTVVIVGWSGADSSFVYVDTWRDGSRMAYEGGITGDKNPDPCLYLGKLSLEHDPARVLTPGDIRFNMIRSRAETEGSEFNTARGSFLEVVSGP
jgi:hypothetical protein